MTDRHEPPPITFRIRAGDRQRELIDRAAERAGSTPEGFVLDAACRQAEDLLLDQVFFRLDDEVFAEFQALLDNPPPPTERFRRLMRTKAPWE